MAMTSSNLSDLPDPSLIRAWIQRLAAASAALTECATFREIAEALAAHLLAGGQFISINLFTYDEAGSFNGFRTIATANRKASFNTDFVLSTTLDELGQPLRDLINHGRPLLVRDVQGDPAVHPKFKSWTESTPLVSSAFWPIRSMGRILGTFNINSVQAPLEISQAEFDFFQPLADQIGALIRLHNLTEESAASQHLARRTRQAFNDLASGQDFATMAHIIARIMVPQRGRFVGINELIYDDRGRVVRWHTLATANRNRSYEWNLVYEMTADDQNSRLHEVFLAGEAFVVEDTEKVGVDELGTLFKEWTSSNGFRSMVSVPVSMGGRPIAVLMAVSRDPASFTPEEVEALHNLAGQMGSLIHARRLVEQTRQARRLVDNLALSNRLITTAEDLPAIAQAVMQTLGQSLSAALITLFDRTLEPGEQPRFHVIAAANAAGAGIDLEGQTIFARAPTAPELRQLAGGTRLLIEGDEILEFLPEALRVHLPQPDLPWLICFGLRSGNRLLGTLALLHSEARPLTLEEHDAFVTLADQIGLALEKRDLLKLTQASLAEARLLYDVNRDLLTAASGLDVLRALRERVAPDALSLTLYAVDWDTASGKLRALTREARISRAGEEQQSQQVLDKIRPEQLKTMYEQWMLFGRKVDLVDDVEQAITERPALQYLLAEGVRSYAVIPIYEGDILIEQININFDQPRRFDPATRRQYEALRDQITVVLQNLRLLTSTQRQAQQLQQIATFSQSIQTSLEQDALLKTALINTWQIVPMDHLAVVLYDSIRAQLYTAAWHDTTGVYIQEADAAPVSLKGTTAGRAWETRDVLHIGNIRQQANLRHTSRGDMLSVIATPIYSRGTVLGILEAASTTPGAYTQTDIIIFRQLVSQLGVALENAEAYRQSQNLARSKALINDITNQLQRQVALENIMNVTVQELGRALGARRGRIRLGMAADQDQSTE